MGRFGNMKNQGRNYIDPLEMAENTLGLLNGVSSPPHMAL